jgi:hypothetical protein
MCRQNKLNIKYFQQIKALYFTIVVVNEMTHTALNWPKYD